MAVVLLTTILWLAGGTDKTISVREVATMAECVKLAEQFAAQVDYQNALNPYPMRQRFAVGCKAWLPADGENA